MEAGQRKQKACESCAEFLAFCGSMTKTYYGFFRLLERSFESAAVMIFLSGFVWVSVFEKSFLGVRIKIKITNTLEASGEILPPINLW